MKPDNVDLNLIIMPDVSNANMLQPIAKHGQFKETIKPNCNNICENQGQSDPVNIEGFFTDHTFTTLNNLIPSSNDDFNIKENSTSEQASCIKAHFNNMLMEQSEAKMTVSSYSPEWLNENHGQNSVDDVEDSSCEYENDNDSEYIPETTSDDENEHLNSDESDCSTVFSEIISTKESSIIVPDLGMHLKICPTFVTNNCNYVLEEEKVTVMQTNNKNQRIWDKRFYCLYCKKPQAKIARHLKSQHSNELDVAEMLSKHGKEKELKLLKLRNQGNHQHNCDVLRSGNGILIVAYRPKFHVSPSEYGPCEYCFGYYVRRHLWKHNCPLKPHLKGKKSNGRKALSCKLLLPPAKGVSSELNAILASLKEDHASLVIKNDSLILDLAKLEFIKVGHDKDQHNYIRTKLREIARLLIELRKVPKFENAALKDFLVPSMFRHVVEAARKVAGFDTGTNQFLTPSLALKLGHSLNKCSKILKGQAIENGDRELEKTSSAFHQLCALNWTVEVSANALRTLHDRKRNKPRILPLTDDIKKLSKYLINTGNDLVIQLKKIEGSTKSSKCPDLDRKWSMLNEILLTQIMLFNRRRQGEVSKIKLADYRKQCSNTCIPDIKSCLSPVEKALCKVLSRFEIVGKRGNTVPVLLTTDMKEKLEVLCHLRNKAGVEANNIFLFARNMYSSTGHIRGTDCIRKLAVSAGTSQPELLRSVRLRKHIATVSQILNLRENELDLLAKFLGHDIRIHREFYRLPDDTLQIAKVAKLLLSLEKGTIASNVGCNFDNMNIGSDEGINNF